MSNWHLNLIYDPLLPGLTTAQTLVLSRLASRADNKHLCWPGAALLAREARMTVRGVYKVLKELEDANLITKRKGTYETHYRNLYEMTYAVEILKKQEKEKFSPANTNRSHPFPSAVETPPSPAQDDEAFLQRLRKTLADRQAQQERYIQTNGKPNPTIAGWIEVSEQKIKALEQKIFQTNESERA